PAIFCKLANLAAWQDADGDGRPDFVWGGQFLGLVWARNATASGAPRLAFDPPAPIAGSGPRAGWRGPGLDPDAFPGTVTSRHPTSSSAEEIPWLSGSVGARKRIPRRPICDPRTGCPGGGGGGGGGGGAGQVPSSTWGFHTWRVTDLNGDRRLDLVTRVSAVTCRTRSRVRRQHHGLFSATTIRGPRHRFVTEPRDVMFGE